MSSSQPESQPLLHSSPTKVIAFEPHDPDDPRNWSKARKWLMVAAIVPIDLSVSWGASGFSPVASDFAKDMGVSPSVAVLGLSMYVLGLAFGPMTLAPLSEYFGRRPVYIVSYGIFLLLLLGTTYVERLGPFLVLRLFSGYFSSTTISNFGGTIADLFHHHDTGPAMSWFLWAATGGSPTGFVLFSFIANGRSWHTVFRIMFFICLTFWVVMVVALYSLGETRHSVILLRRARALRQQTGDEEIEVPDEMKQRGPKQLFSTALARPFRFLGSEAIVQFGALYNGFLYGLSFLFNGAFHMIFGPSGYGFDTIGVGISFLGIVVGITLGLATNVLQERYYQRQVSQAGHRDVPEARVHHAKLAAIVLPVSLLAFALTATPNIHPFFAVLASAFWGWSFYTLILMTLTYTEDAYKTYSASALAGIGLIRNLAGAGFPLVGRHLFLNVGTRNASLVLMAIAICLAPIPFVLERRGVSLRKRSPWAAAHEDEDENS
ncbi:major facilitator superfamily domain-containing protein [Alternaria rosae]|uniref:major facilitator superfamily domain-containing protein n=1 Tax=Alternaria rosae TaxID=1187941 RepID=UPI001E8D5E14|nr:major facilitator superfamily domain-containing protein [Alternaria rosae]KAH6870629.1 major facilitator superfamily domain-containing protein [Alternaria rosae]